MPIYQFQCWDCGTAQEAYLKEPVPSRPCPCGGEARRVFSSHAVLVRPVGWDRHPEDPAYWKDLEPREERPRWQR